MIRGYGFGPRGFGHGFTAIGHAGWMSFIPLAVHLVFWVLIIIMALIFFRRHSAKLSKMHKENDPALRILRERYALGEIETEEFERRKQDLTI